MEPIPKPLGIALATLGFLTLYIGSDLVLTEKLPWGGFHSSYFARTFRYEWIPGWGMEFYRPLVAVEEIATGQDIVKNTFWKWQ